jgi:hypothetical protein
MKRLKLTHGYHDALVRAVRYRDEADVILDVDLCSCCNPWQANTERPYIDEIIGIFRHEGRGYVLDLMTAGGVHADARGLHEA